MRHLPMRRVVMIVLALVAVFFATKWKANSDRGGQKPAEPFRIAGNLYYVGASDAAAFLITGPRGHVVIDGGYPGTAPMIMASIAKLGFDIKDVEVLVNSEPHIDHAGGLAELQRASGAELRVAESPPDSSGFRRSSGGIHSAGIDSPGSGVILRTRVETAPA